MRQSTDRQYKIDVLQKTLDWYDAYPDRFNPLLACYHGFKAFYHGPELVDESELPKLCEEIRTKVKFAILNQN